MRQCSYLYFYISGEDGRYLYRVASGKPDPGAINYEAKCLDWYLSQNMEYIWFQKMFTLSCPCDRRLALLDRRWQWDRHQKWSESQISCFYQRNMRFTSATQVWISCVKNMYSWLQHNISASDQQNINIYNNNQSIQIK